MNENNDFISTEFTTEEIDTCLKVLQSFAEKSEQLTLLTHEQRVAMFKASGSISRPDREEAKKRQKDVKKLRKQNEKMANRSARRLTGIRTARENTIFTAPLQIEFTPAQEETREYATPHDCYVCREKFTKIHHFYDTMCPKCADFNYAKRFQTADLTGQVALITGSRLKIGYHTTLMLLRAGATVIATTRFPVDSALRYSKESDYSVWKDRLRIYGLDLRHTPSVEIFCRYIEHKYERLDILINNAAQTVRRPSGFYAHLMEMKAKQLQIYHLKRPIFLMSINTASVNCNHSLSVTTKTFQSLGMTRPQGLDSELQHSCLKFLMVLIIPLWPKKFSLLEN